MGDSHFVKVCERCGAVIAQCRCMSCDKAVVVKGLCAKCAAQPQDKGSAGQQSASPCNSQITPCSTCGGSGMSVVWNFCPECGRRL